MPTCSTTTHKILGLVVLLSGFCTPFIYGQRGAAHAPTRAYIQRSYTAPQGVGESSARPPTVVQPQATIPYTPVYPYRSSGFAYYPYETGYHRQRRNIGQDTLIDWPRHTISIQTSLLSVPSGAFAAADVNDGGFANAAWGADISKNRNISIEYDYHPKTALGSSLSFGALWSIQHTAFDNSRYASYLNALWYTNATVLANEGYKMYSFMLGVKFYQPIASSSSRSPIFLYEKIYAGLSNVYLPRIVIQQSNAPIIDQASAWAFSPCMLLGLGVQKKIISHFNATLSVDFYAAQPLFTNVSLTEYGTVRTVTYEKIEQSISLVNVFNIGVSYSLD